MLRPCHTCVWSVRSIVCILLFYIAEQPLSDLSFPLSSRRVEILKFSNNKIISRYVMVITYTPFFT